MQKETTGLGGGGGAEGKEGGGGGGGGKGEGGGAAVGWPDRLVLVEVGLLEVAELGLQVLEVLCNALVLLSQPHVGFCVLLLMLGVALLQEHKAVRYGHVIDHSPHFSSYNTRTLACLKKASLCYGQQEEASKKPGWFARVGAQGDDKPCTGCLRNVAHDV